MTLSASSLTHTTYVSTATSLTTASVTPAANAVLVLFVAEGGTAAAVSAVSGLGLTWTQRASIVNTSNLDCWTAPVGGSPSTGTVAITFSASSNPGAYDLIQVTGGGTVVGTNVVTNTGSSTASSVTLGAAQGSSSLFLFAMGCLLVKRATAITTAPSESPAWTELSDQSQTNNNFQNATLETQVSPDASNLTGSGTLSTSKAWETVGIEIASGASPSPGQFFIMF